MEIRDFIIEDHDSLYTIALESWKVAYSQRYSEQEIIKIINDWYSKENHLGMINKIIDKSLFFKVLLIDNEIVGYCLGDLIDCKLHRLYIHPSQFNNGYGSLLLRRFEEELIKKDKWSLTLSCDQLNSVGLNFYIKRGFIIISENDEDYILQKELK
jgi:ribosomal protein S18 acetylase RimI-like enzyme